MKKLTEEMKQELAANKMTAEANARIRNGETSNNRVFKATKSPARIIPERKPNFYKTENRVSDWYWVGEDEGIQQVSEPRYRGRAAR